MGLSRSGWESLQETQALGVRFQTGGRCPLAVPVGMPGRQLEVDASGARERSGLELST